MSDAAGRAKRVAVSLKINLKLPNKESFVERFAQNISRTGIFIRAKEPLAVGARVSFEYRLADDSRLVRGVGIVRWRRPESEASEAQPPGMGIEFTDLDPATDALVAEIVAKHGEGERAPKREAKKADLNEAGTVSLDLSEENLLDALAPPRPAPVLAIGPAVATPAPAPVAPPPSPAPAPVPPAAEAPPPIVAAPPVEAAPAPAAAAEPPAVSAPSAFPEAPSFDAPPAGEPEAAPAAVDPPVPEPEPKAPTSPAAEPAPAAADAPSLSEPGAGLEVEVEAPAAAPTVPEAAPAPVAPVATALAADLASAALRLRRNGAEDRALPWHSDNTGKRVDAGGTAVPAPLRLYGLSAASRQVLLRRSGLAAVADSAHEPHLKIGDQSVSVTALLRSALGEIASTPTSELRLVIPTDTDESGRAALFAACAELGLPTPLLIDSAAALATAQPAPAPRFVLELERVGASIAEVEDGTVTQSAFAADAGWFEVQGAADDPQRLLAQSERLVLLIDRFLTQCNVGAQDSNSLLVYTEAPLWPGLLEAIGAWAPSLRIVQTSDEWARLHT